MKQGPTNQEINTVAAGYWLYRREVAFNVIGTPAGITILPAQQELNAD